MQLSTPPGPPVYNFGSRKDKRADEQWTLHPPSINLVSLPLLFLSLYMQVIMTPSSIILLSLLFSWNCLIICYRFVFTHIILPVICSISSHKHTAHFRRPPFEDYCRWHLREASGFWSIAAVAMGMNLTYLSLPKAQQATRRWCNGSTGFYPSATPRARVNLC